jgi:HlyD family secretion protein
MLTLLAGLLAALLLASCSKPDNGYQGWIEANLIFVAPDEVGRVQTLSVREGDTVKTGDTLFTVDDDLQRADLDQIKASVTNAQQTYDRASMLLKSGSGTQKDYDAELAVLRDARAAASSAPSTAPCSRSTTVPARWCPPAGRCCRCCRRATSRCASTYPRRRCRRSPTATR